MTYILNYKINMFSKRHLGYNMFITTEITTIITVQPYVKTSQNFHGIECRLGLQLHYKYN